MQPNFRSCSLIIALRSSKERMTKCSLSSFAYFAKSAFSISKGPGARKRCPFISLLALRPSRSQSISSLPRRQQSERIGRAKVVGFTSQRMDFGERSPLISSGIFPFKSSVVFFPPSFTLAKRYSLPFSSTRPILSKGRPTFRAKFSAALVGAPSLKETETGGPFTSLSLTDCTSESSAQKKASLLGVQAHTTSECSNMAEVK